MKSVTIKPFPVSLTKEDCPVTIYDIACKAGVSTATVSRVLNHTGRVSEESRRKVEEVIAR